MVALISPLTVHFHSLCVVDEVLREPNYQSQKSLLSCGEYIYILYHHTVQVAICVYSFVSTLVNALVLRGKTAPVQVAVHDDHHECKYSICASWWGVKHHQHKLHSVKIILGTSIGAGCSNQVQVAQEKDMH